MYSSIENLLKNYKPCDIEYITDCDRTILYGIRNGQPVYRQRQGEEVSNLAVKANEEKSQLDAIHDQIVLTLCAKEPTSTELKELQAVVLRNLDRCLQVGYQSTGLDYVALLADSRLVNDKAPVKNVDDKIFNGIQQTIHGYAKRSILNNRPMKDRVLSMIKDGQKGKFGAVMQKLPAKAYAETYNHLSPVFFEDPNTLMTVSLNPADQITDKDIQKCVNVKSK